MIFRNKLSELPKWVFPAFIAVCALTIRTIYFFDFKDNPFFDHVSPNMDNGNYDWGARLFASGDWLIDIPRGHSPLYMYVLGVIYALMGRDFSVVWIFQFGLGIVASVMIFHAGRLLAGTGIGFLAGLLFALNGIVLFYEGLLLRESLSLFFLILSFLFLLKASFVSESFLDVPTPKLKKTRSQNFYLVFGFVALSIAVQIRPNFGILLPLLLLYFFWGPLNGKPIRDRIIKLVGYTALFFGLMIPLIVRGYLVFDKWYFLDTSGSYVFLLGNLSLYPGTGFEHYPLFESWIQKFGLFLSFKQAFSIVWDNLISNPWAFAQMYLRKLFFIFSSYEAASNVSYYAFAQFSKALKIPVSGFGFIAALGFWGVIFSLRRWRQFSLVYLYLMGLILGIWLFYPVSRFRYVLIPWFILLGSYGVVSFFSETFLKQKLKSFASGVCLVFLIWSFISPKWLKAEGRFVDYCNIAIAYFENGRVFDLSKVERQSQICWKKEAIRDLDHFQAGKLLSTTYNLSAGYFLDKGKNDDAIKYLKASREILPFQSFPYLLLAQIYQNMGLNKEAIHAAQMGLAANPGDQILLERLANLYIEKKQFSSSWPIWVHLLENSASDQAREKARKKLIYLESKIPKLPELNSLLKQADLLYDNQQWKKARAFFERINEVNRSESLLFVKEASINGFLKNYEKAEKAFLRALAIKPDDPDILRMLADLYLFTPKQSKLLAYIYLSRFVQAGKETAEYKDRIHIFQKIKYEFGNKKLNPLIEGMTAEENQKIFQFYKRQSGKSE